MIARTQEARDSGVTDSLLILEDVEGLPLVDVTVAGERFDDLAGSAVSGAR